MPNASLVLYNSISLHVAGQFRADRAAVNFREADPVSQIQLKSTAVVTLKDSLFDGLGIIEVDTGATFNEVSACKIEKNITLAFADIRKTMIHTWRNTDWESKTTDLLESWHGNKPPMVCDAGGTGQQSGCDRRAICQNEDKGGVRCVCNGSVTEALSPGVQLRYMPGVMDHGTQCVQTAALDTRFEKKSTTVTIQKVRTL